jgi:PAS domain S-box-containing protein
MPRKRTLKQEAVARIRANELPLLELARIYNVSTNTLRTWLRETEVRERVQEDARRVATSLSPEDCSTTSDRERLLMHALEYSPATIIITDTAGRIVYANPKFSATTGYEVGEAIGQNPRILKSGETSSNEYSNLWKTILSGKEWRGIFHNRRKDGQLYWERASISPVLTPEGQVSHFMAVKEDITEFMENELASRRQAASYAAIFAALPHAVLVVDQQACIQFANPASEQLFDTPLPAGLRFDQLNLRWLDSHGMGLTSSAHPLTEYLAQNRTTPVTALRMGIVPPTDGVRWVQLSLQALTLPEANAAVLLTLTAAD